MISSSMPKNISREACELVRSMYGQLSSVTTIICKIVVDQKLEQFRKCLSMRWVDSVLLEKLVRGNSVAVGMRVRGVGVK